MLDKPLTKTEERVLSLILDGKTNKEIAGLLNRGLRMIEWYRSSIMRKFGAENVIDLVKRAAEMGLHDTTE